MGQGSKRGLCSSRCPVPGMCPWSGARVDVETHVDVPLIPPWLSPTKDETQQQSCQGNNIEKRQFKERELYFFLLMFLFKSVHSTSTRLFCSVIYRVWRPDEVFTRDKCSWGLEITESLMYGLIQSSLKAAGNLLPFMVCGFGPPQGLIYLQEGEICLSRTGNDILQNPHGLPAVLHPSNLFWENHRISWVGRNP